jgi:hypothetical protein
MEDTRVLARIVRIDDVLPHPNADKMQLGIVGGWQCCIKLDEFKKGDLALYCEIDSLLPVSVPEFAFLEDRKESIKVVNEVVYSRIKTIRLRKELSQGLLGKIPRQLGKVVEGQDVTEALGIIKYEKKQTRVSDGPELKPGLIKRFCEWLRKDIKDDLLLPWPYFIKKTEQERVQNLHSQYLKAVEDGETFEESVKLNGESFTAFFVFKDGVHGHAGVCSRNYEIQTTDVVWTWKQSFRYWLSRFVGGNSRILRTRHFVWPDWRTGVKADDDPFVRHWKRLDLAKKLEDYQYKSGVQIAIQGELAGPGHQSNKEGLETADVYVYQVYVIDSDFGMKMGLLLPEDARRVTEELGLKYVPVPEKNAKLPPTIKEALLRADGPAYFDKSRSREGLVYKSNTRDFSFKVISNKFLEKNEDE